MTSGIKRTRCNSVTTAGLDAGAGAGACAGAVAAAMQVQRPCLLPTDSAQQCQRSLHALWSSGTLKHQQLEVKHQRQYQHTEAHTALQHALSPHRHAFQT